MAAWQGKTRNVALMLSKNGDPALVADPAGDGPGGSSVHVAARFGDISVIKFGAQELLIENGIEHVVLKGNVTKRDSE